MGIPVDVTVRLVVNTITFAITNALIQAIAGTSLPFLRSGLYRSSIAC
ncbi:hypothetical protein [Robinsoniella sp. KNHs210]|nr:hypothetical protein [Robinsoniella sp. KNHs210]